MISFFNNTFKIDTKSSSYIFSISKFKHLLHHYYGVKIEDEKDLDFSFIKISTPSGTSVSYLDEEDSNYVLDMYLLEYSCFGKGDYKNPSINIKTQSGYLLDLVYLKHEIINGIPNLKDMPNIHGKDLETLVITCFDKAKQIYVDFNYIVDYENDVIIRNSIIRNCSKNDITILKVSSLQLDLINNDFDILSLYGAWGMEAHLDRARIKHNIYSIDSKTGNSSNRHNPLFFICDNNANDNYGYVYGFNLIYSGNHEEIIELSTFDQLRITSGISSFNFNYTLKQDEIFESPYAIMSFSDSGFNKISQQFHNFIKSHILPLNFVDKNPPILINNWEATYFKFTYRKIKSIIKKAHDFDLELFVLDDGWFSNRNDDSHGLGDYDINKKKLPFGLKNLAKSAQKKNISFGIWVEPEMCNQESKLYAQHKDYIISSPLYKPSKGRHQFVLDLTKSCVRNYIIESLDNLLNSAPITYVKWDMNRNISDVDSEGNFYHDYMIGLYSILKEIKNRHPDVYFEGCASGGNRFDLGVLCYFNSIWASDNTDSFERLFIQKGLSLGYPLKCISAHISQVPSHSLLRNTSLETRFNRALFANLGYELDLSTLLPYEKKQIKEQVEFYKKYRQTIFNGDYYSYKDVKKDGYTLNYVVSKDKNLAIVGVFIGAAKMNPHPIDFKIFGLDPLKYYKIKIKDYKNNISIFGGLINTLLPFHINERGWIIQTISKFKQIDGETFEYTLSGKALINGALKLNQQWMGTGYNENVSIYKDFGSHIFIIERVDKNEH